MFFNEVYKIKQGDVKKNSKGGNVVTMYCFCLTQMVKGQTQASEMIN